MWHRQNSWPKSLAISWVLLLTLWSSPSQALPGFFDLGGLAALILSPDDSTSLYRKVELKEQNLEIYLEKTQAFIRGEFHLVNLSSDTLQLRLALPKSLSLTHPDLYVMQFRNVDSLVIWVDSLRLASQAVRLNPGNLEPGSGSMQLLAWEEVLLSLAPGQSRTIRTYAKVKTNRAYLRQGYGKDFGAGLAFCLSTANPWHGSIGKGYWRISLGKGLNYSDIQALFPDARFHYQADSRTFVYRFEDLRPKPEDDLIIRYAAPLSQVEEDSTIAYLAHMFNTLDNLASQGLPKLNPELTRLHNLDVKDWKSSSGFLWAMFVLIFGLPFIVITVGVITVWRRMRETKQKKAE